MDSLNRGFMLAITVALLFGCSPASSANEEEKRYQAVREYWEWGNYWDTLGVDFHGASYKPGLSFEATVFFLAPGTASFDSEPVWGFCAKELLVCQAYWALKDGSISHSTHTIMRVRESTEQAFGRFREQRFHEAPEVPFPIGLVLVPTAPGQTREILAPSEPPSRMSVVHRKTVTLGKLDIPKATRLRRRNSFVEDWVKSLGPPNECRTTVPFADERSFVVPVLTECPQEKSIMLMRREGDEWVATPGGWIRIQAEVAEPIEDRIRAHPSLVIHPQRRNK